MKESCASCKFCIPMEVIPVNAYKTYVCNLFRELGESDAVQYIGSNTGMCEMYTRREDNDKD